MKKIIKYLCLLFFCIFAIPAAVEAAGTNSLTVENNKVAVSVSIPEGKTETVTSLRMQLLVTAASGSMGEPKFQFEKGIPSMVQDAAISSRGENAYVVDLVLSGKRDQNIFGGSEYVRLGTLSFQPASKAYTIKVEVVPAGDNTQEPSVTYVDANGLSAMTVPLADAEPVTVTEANQEQPVQKPFNPKVKLKASVKKGSNRVDFKWEKVADADGYVLYRFDTKAKKCTLLKTIKGAGTTTYAKTFPYGSTYAFKIRAFKENADGSVKYGYYSPAAKVKISLAQVTGFLPEYQSISKVSMSWKKVDGAKGYQIYRSTKKNGKYTLVKTIKKGKATSCSNIRHLDGEVYYYKIRAYTVDAEGRQAYGAYSAKQTAAPQKPALRLKKKPGNQVTLSWKKVTRADGYAVYRSSSKSGKYVCVKTIKDAKITSFTAKLPKGKKSCYYKVCAFEKQNGKNRMGAYSAVKKAR